MTKEEMELKAFQALTPDDPINPNGKKIAGVKGTDEGTYFKYSFSSGKELLSALDIQSELYLSKYYNVKHKFIFRGHRDATWPLVPSVYRPPIDRLERKKHIENIIAHSRGCIIEYEVKPFARFLNEINNLGYLIEDESIALMEYYKIKSNIHKFGLNHEDRLRESEKFFPTKNQMRILSLAQHFGLPTRLLDWSTNPYKALFFAVDSIDNTRKTEGIDIGIWVIPSLLLDAIGISKFLELIEVPKFQNTNVIAQEGLFTSYVPSIAQQILSKTFPINKDNNGVMGFDEYLCDTGENRLLADITGNLIGKPMLFTLKHNETLPIQEKLEQLGISWTTMMPNLEGAVKEAIRG
ncbi:MAG: FRG domain-containing protein [Methylococcaceae bacterium]|nr:FRG domain-containing protein [Methylococcaceae bacterium]